MRVRFLAIASLIAFTATFVACGGGDDPVQDTSSTVDEGSSTVDNGTDPVDEGTTPPADEGTTPPTDEGTTPPADEGTVPPTDEGTVPPVDGGTTSLEDGAGIDTLILVDDAGSLDVPSVAGDAPQGPPADAPPPSEAPTWTADIAPNFALADKCGGCHTGDNSGGHNCLSNYDDCLKASTTCSGKTVGACLMDRINDGTMPPFGGFIPPDWKTELQAWIDAGLPE